MKLTNEEQDILNGSQGKVKQQAMKILVQYGEAVNADRLLDVDDVTFCIPCPYPCNTNADIEFENMDALFSWADLCSEDEVFTDIPKVQSRRCTSLAGVNPCKQYMEYVGIKDQKYYDGVDATDDFFKQIGVNHCLTCTPQLVGHIPAKGEHTVCGESSQVIFQNSVLGARVNCHGLVAGACAAMVGKIPNSGMHLDENRKGTHEIIVDKIPKSLFEWDLMGFWIGKHVVSGVPVIEMDVPHVTMDEHKSFGAAMCSSGQVDLYHIVGLTPEAQTRELAFSGNEPLEVFHYGEEQEKEMLEFLDYAKEDYVDTILLGCPHYSIFQIRDIAEMLEGKKCKANLIIMTARQILTQARENGYAQIIEAAGACCLTDACPPMINMWPEGTKVIATDSAKMAFYCAGGEFNIHMGSMEHCIEAAITGKW